MQCNYFKSDEREDVREIVKPDYIKKNTLTLESLEE